MLEVHWSLFVLVVVAFYGLGLLRGWVAGRAREMLARGNEDGCAGD